MKNYFRSTKDKPNTIVLIVPFIRTFYMLVQVLLENGEDKDNEGCDLLSLTYVSHEKQPRHPHHYKASALNALVWSTLLFYFL